MLAREVIPPPEHIYPPDEWRLVETRPDADWIDRAETMYALGNGFLGIRGSFEEGRPSLSPGTFVNGFHETWPISYPEEAYGLARTGQTIVNVPDATVLRLYVDDEPLYLPVARLEGYQRVLDMREGVLWREFTWSTPSGKHVRVRSQRLVSLEHRHLAAFLYEVTLEDHPAPVSISSQLLNRQDAKPADEPRSDRPLDPRLAQDFDHRVLGLEHQQLEDKRFLLGYRTANSRMTLGVGVDHVIETDCAHELESEIGEDMSKLVVNADAEPGKPIRVIKYATYQTSRTVPARELGDRCRRTLRRATRDGFGALRRTQREHLDRFWHRADVQASVGSDRIRTQQAIRWNVFQLGQASWRAEGASIPAKGLSGQAYEGHYFWDTEVYVLPFLAYTQPRIARNILRFRHSMLDRARKRARELSQEGALFPWRTINGEEASAFYAAGTAQYHINADIAHAVRKYVDVRGDYGLLAEAGAAILVETARMWADLGFYGRDGRFHIHSVTGPDEYTTVVNDNTFTNLMARMNLSYAAQALDLLARERRKEHRALVADLGVTDEEVARWREAAEAMYVPYDEPLGMNPQDESFLDREVWDLEATPGDHFPLLLHYHPLVIYRYQVLKQADVVLAMFLLGDEFTAEEKRRNFDYYDPLTTGDSSLSACMQSIVAAEIGHEAKACEYFEYALMMDLADLAGNVSDGIHIASAGGVWQTLVFGFGGVRDSGGELSLAPRLPSGWQRLAFPLRFQDRQLQVEVTHQHHRVTLEEGEPLTITLDGRAYELEVGEPLEVVPGEAS